MFKTVTFEDEMRRREYRRILNEVLHLDMMLFMLDSRLSELERRWPGKTPEEQRRLQTTRLEIWAEFEGIKVDVAEVERRGKAYDRELAAVIARREAGKAAEI